MNAATATRPDRSARAPRWGIASFPAIGTTARVLVTRAQRLGDAAEVAEAADVAVEGPAGVVALLSDLADALDAPA